MGIPYTLGEILGRGGNSEVYSGTAADGSRVAVKLLGRGSKIRASQAHRYASEIAIMKQLTGTPGVMPLLDSGNDDDGRLWYSMPVANVMHKIDLSTESPSDLVSVVLRIAEALARLEVQGVFHRDVKPSNLFMLTDGSWVIGDFGLHKSPGNRERLGGGKLGPLWYIAPEMVNPVKETFTDRADVFSLAKVLWVVLTDQRYPFPGPHARTFEGAWISRYREVPRSDILDDLIVRATNADAPRRPSMAEFRDELKEWLTPSSPAYFPDVDLSQIAAAITVEGTRARTRAQTRDDMRAQVDGIKGMAADLLAPVVEKLRSFGDNFTAEPCSGGIIVETYGVDGVQFYTGIAVGLQTKVNSLLRLCSGYGIAATGGRVTIVAGHVIEDFTGFGPRNVRIAQFRRDMTANSPLIKQHLEALRSDLMRTLPEAAQQFADLLTVRQKESRPY